MESLAIAVVGAGRAGGAVALAAARAGHRVSVVAGPTGRLPPDLADRRVPLEATALADLTVVATPDDAIAEVGETVGGGAVIHLSGFTSIEALSIHAHHGSLHPLMTIADARSGADALGGAPAAITGSDEPTERLIGGFAASIGMAPFGLADDRRRIYHAGATVAANATTGVLGLAFDLFEAAGVDPTLARSLVEAAVANSFEIGPDRALTGPVARGDDRTVAAQREAVAELDDRLSAQFDSVVRVLESRVSR